MGLIREGPLIEGRYLQLEAYQRGSFIGKEDFQRGRGFRVLFSISESDLKIHLPITRVISFVNFRCPLPVNVLSTCFGS